MKSRTIIFDIKKERVANENLSDKNIFNNHEWLATKPRKRDGKRWTKQLVA